MRALAPALRPAGRWSIEGQRAISRARDLPLSCVPLLQASSLASPRSCLRLLVLCTAPASGERRAASGERRARARGQDLLASRLARPLVHAAHRTQICFAHWTVLRAAWLPGRRSPAVLVLSSLSPIESQILYSPTLPATQPTSRLTCSFLLSSSPLWTSLSASSSRSVSLAVSSGSSTRPRRGVEEGGKEETAEAGEGRESKEEGGRVRKRVGEGLEILRAGPSASRASESASR